MVRKGDRIVIGGILVTTLLLFAMRKMTVGGTQVVITRNGETYAAYDLTEDRTVEIKGENGTNTVQILDGSVSMTEASCPDQVCVHTAPLSEEKGGIIVCLPHELVVELKK